MEYNFKEIESNWQAYWAKHKTFAAKDGGDKPKYYVLDMFPYPSGAGLHVGHPLGYIASDIVARYKRHKGFNVLHPMGYDSFGLPAEQYAIQTGQHPKITTENNIAVYRKQLDKIGFSFDWDREVRTSDPEYYKWTQWIFIQLFNSWYNNSSNKAENISSLITEFEKNGNAKVNACCDENVKAFTAAEWKGFSEKEQSDILMAYRITYLGEAYVNWCPQLGTVLANDEVKDGVSERGGYPVERKLMRQWSMRITAYAQRLLDGLDELDWTESLKEAQRNWIGRSEGSSLKFKTTLKGRETVVSLSKSSVEVVDTSFSDIYIEVFTTRPDTVFGVSFVTLAPEHELVEILTTAEQKAVVEDYVTKAKNRSERERQADVTKITGVFTGSYVEHPFTGKQIPIWIGDYVLAGYGTGAVMAVPAHDTRDYSFAKHFNLPLMEVIEGGDITKEAYDAKEGKLINSDFLNGLEVKDAMKKIIAEIEARGLGKGKINFRLRDAVFGRQRYWGEPIPVYYKRLSPTLSEGEGAIIPCVVDEKDLPIRLPEVDKYLPTEDGEPPLARAKNWTYSPPSGESEGALETSTMPGWAGSSWYFLRYMDAHNGSVFADKKLSDYWQQVDLYIGGSEHATGHLLYVRFWTKFLKDLGYIATDEPAKKLINQGMIGGTSELIKEVRINRDEIEAYNSISKEIIIRKEGRELIRLSIGNGSDHCHVYLSYDSMLEVEYFDRVNEKVIKTEVFQENRANVKYVMNSILNIEKWMEAEPIYYNGSILISDEGYWSKGEYYDFDGNKTQNISIKTKPVVEKMSKRWNNVVNPDDICETFGADTLRLYEMFLGPLEQSKPWNTNGITGVHGFLKKLWRLFYMSPSGGGAQGAGEDARNLSATINVIDAEPTKGELKTLHKTIKKVIEDIERFSFNTSVSTFMICVNELTEAKCNKKAILEPLLICLSPYAPHIAEELWKQLGYTESIALANFPEVNEAYLVDDAFNYPVSFNGKMRFTLELAATLTPQEVEAIVMQNENTAKYLEGKQPKKVIVVPKKIVNIVV